MEKMNELLFTDDQAMLSNCKSEIQNHTNQLNRSCINNSTSSSVSTTEVMTVGRNTGKLDISIDGTQMDNYTGVTGRNLPRKVTNNVPFHFLANQGRFSCF